MLNFILTLLGLVCIFFAWAALELGGEALERTKAGLYSKGRPTDAVWTFRIVGLALCIVAFTCWHLVLR